MLDNGKSDDDCSIRILDCPHHRWEAERAEIGVEGQNEPFSRAITIPRSLLHLSFQPASNSRHPHSTAGSKAIVLTDQMVRALPTGIQKVVLRMQTEGLRCTYSIGTIRDAIYSIFKVLTRNQPGLAQWQHSNRRPLLERKSEGLRLST